MLRTYEYGHVNYAWRCPGHDDSSGQNAEQQ